MKLSRRQFIQRAGLGIAGACLAQSLPAADATSASAYTGLPRSSPDAQGVAPVAIIDFINSIESRKLGLHSFMLVRHGHVIADGWWKPYEPDLKHTLYSLSKSFTSTAVGLAVEEGHFGYEDKVISFFPDELPETVGPNLAAMKVKHLLMMGTGHAKDAFSEIGLGVLDSGEDWIRIALAQPVEFEPGTHFTYNNAAPYLLSAILQRKTGQTLSQYLKPRLFDPLGIDEWYWESSSQGIDLGMAGLCLKTEDIAKFGQLYLQKGVWNGNQILTEKWIHRATRFHLATSGEPDLPERPPDWSQGYGYMFWRCRHDAYRGDGAMGQFCVIMPKQDAVVVITSEVSELQAVLNCVWDHMLPAMKEHTKIDGSAQSALNEKLESLALPTPNGGNSSAAFPAGEKRTYDIEQNEIGVNWVDIAIKNETCIFSFKDANGKHEVVCGVGHWVDGETDLSPAHLHVVTTRRDGVSGTKISASCAWRDEKTLVMYWQFTETAHYDSVTCHFEDDKLRIEFKRSISILHPDNKDKRPILIGKAV